MTNAAPGIQPLDLNFPSFTLTPLAKICTLPAGPAARLAALLPSFDAETRVLFRFRLPFYLGHDAVSKLITY